MSDDKASTATVEDLFEAEAAMRRCALEYYVAFNTPQSETYREKCRRDLRMAARNYAKKASVVESAVRRTGT